MKNMKLLLVSLSLMTGSLMAQEPTVTNLMVKDLVGIPGKEVLMVTVEYPREELTPYIGTMHRDLFTSSKARW